MIKQKLMEKSERRESKGPMRGAGRVSWVLSEGSPGVSLRSCLYATRRKGRRHVRTINNKERETNENKIPEKACEGSRKSAPAKIVKKPDQKARDNYRKEEKTIRSIKKDCNDLVREEAATECKREADYRMVQRREQAG